MDCNDDRCNPWKRKDKDKFDEFFGEGFGLDEMVKRMFGDFANFDDLFKTEGMSEQPYVRGFSIRMGPEGKPEIKEFGNAGGEFKESENKVPGEQQQETLIDVMKDDDEVHVIADMPGIDKKDLDINASKSSVTIKAEGESRSYSEKVDLGCEVFPDSRKARYNNGVLEIVFKRKEPSEEEKEEDTRVEVE